MKMFVPAMAALLVLSSCIFKEPFEATAKIPVDQALLGRWEGTTDNDKPRMLVLQHSANEYSVKYAVDNPAGEKALFFRAYPIELEGGRYIQTQLIGTAEGPVKPEDRKFSLLKVKQSGDSLEILTIYGSVLGVREDGDTAALRAAFAKHRDDPKLFRDPGTFKRIK